MAGRGQGSEHGRRTPRGELERIRESEQQRTLALRERIMETMLEACGELGYRNVSVQHVLDRYGGYRLQFYRQFESKADCYAAAYAAEIDRLCGTLIGADAAKPIGGLDGDGSKRRAGTEKPDWRQCLRDGLCELARFVSERPQLARGLLIEVHVAGGPALVKREEVFERLSRAIDSARRENESRHSPPPITARFMVGVVDSAVVSALANRDPQRFANAVPELARIIVAPYFGEEAAGEELAALRVA